MLENMNFEIADAWKLLAVSDIRQACAVSRKLGTPKNNMVL